MSESTRYRWSVQSHRAYLERQAARDQRHQEYLERQAARDQRHQEYLERQAAREQRHQEYLQRQAARESRQQEYYDRVQESTSQYRTRYSALVADMTRQGLEQFMPTEFTQVQAQLATLDDLLDSDPVQARELSLQLGAEISRLSSMAREAKREFEARERQRQREISEMRRKATSELSQFLQSLIGDISDPIEQDFAFDGLRLLQAEYAGRVVDAHELPKVKQDLRSRAQTIRDAATAKAKAWKDRKGQETLHEAQEMLLAIHKEQADADASRNPKAVQSMLDCLDTMRQQIAAGGCSLDDIQKQLVAETEKTDVAVADENCRRMVVRSIMDSLEKSGFVVGKPQRQTGEKDEVVILARKPAGAEAAFRVTADGTMVYKFDNYEGMKCKADIDQVLPMLQEVYGVELSDVRVLWQNPDRNDRTAKPIDAGSKEQSHG